MTKNKEMNPLMVSIWCLAYNHERYIRQCLNGIVMQKTNFRFEAIVHDDASTDGTASIIKEYAEKYPNIIKPIFEKENQYSKFDGSLERIMIESCLGEYVAMCEGDDYWTDPLKLQKQVDAMCEYPDVMLSHTGFRLVDEHNNQILHHKYNEYMICSNSGDNLLKLFNGNYIMTLTTMCRRDVITSNEYMNCPSKYDYTLALAAAIKGNTVYIQDITASYRVTSTGAMATRKEIVNSGIYLSYKYFSKLLLSGYSKKISLLHQLLIRIHILVHAYRMNDFCFIRECIQTDKAIIILLPVAYVYSKITKSKKHK